MPSPQPDRRQLSRRLQEVEEALRETPPHAAAGARQRLEAERARLQRLLATPPRG